MLTEPATLKEALAEIARLKEANADLHSTMDAWFVMSKKIEDEVTSILIDGLEGYLRTSRSGGMPTKLSNAVEAVLKDYCRLYVGKALLPVLRGLASPASAFDEADRLLLLQARNVLRALNKERPDCGYGTLAEACEQIALAPTDTERTRQVAEALSEIAANLVGSSKRPDDPAITSTLRNLADLKISLTNKSKDRRPRVATEDLTKDAAHVIDPDLVRRAAEILDWRRSGLLHGGSGGALREMARQLEEQGISDTHSLGVAEQNTYRDAMAEIVRLADVLTKGPDLPQVMWWNGRMGPPAGLAEALEDYATIKPGAERDKWAMKAAAEWIRKVVALHEPARRETAEAAPTDTSPAP
ncbi:hypothetical protein ACVIGB_000749 [Bradyrhizobium sp. USDA 4341]